MNYSHYFKEVPQGVTHIDVYRVIALYKITHPAQQHLVKKALCAGTRGAKDTEQDLMEVIDSALRMLQMMQENGEISLGAYSVKDNKIIKIVAPKPMPIPTSDVDTRKGPGFAIPPPCPPAPSDPGWPK